MLDYGFNFINIHIFIDNESTISIVKNPVYHSKTKHIEIRHHFIIDSYEKKDIQVLKIHIDDNVADLLTKAFDGPRFNFLVIVPTGEMVFLLEFLRHLISLADIPLLVIKIALFTTIASQTFKMANLKYSDKHNMVAFLKKPNGSDGFHEIVDFLKRTL
ncbi:hypothetical protein Tco_1550817, partial [Tanacetum coccineum]